MSWHPLPVEWLPRLPLSMLRLLLLWLPAFACTLGMLPANVAAIVAGDDGDAVVDDAHYCFPIVTTVA